MTQETTVRWLKFASGLTAFFGLLVAASAAPAAAAPVEFLADLIFLPLDGAENVGSKETRLMAAIGGGVMTGWGIMLWLLAGRLYSTEPVLARQLIVSSIVAWFVVDSTGSVLSGAPLNVVFNTGFLLVFCVPLWLGARGDAS